jgi:hypothetical protein
MKTQKTILFCAACILVFLVAGALSCVIRVKYSSLPGMRSQFAYSYVANLGRYSFLQYNQASPDQGRKALLEYLKLIQRIRDERIQYSQNTLHKDFGLTYLRLYRIESAEGNSAAADDYMKASQKEWAALGWKNQDVSIEALNRLIEKREGNERKLYNTSDAQTPTAQAKKDKSKENSE